MGVDAPAVEETTNFGILSSDEANILHFLRTEPIFQGQNGFYPVSSIRILLTVFMSSGLSTPMHR